MAGPCVRRERRWVSLLPRSRGGHAALEIPARAVGWQDSGQRQAHLRVAGAWGTGVARRQDLLLRQHLAVHGGVHLRARCHDGPRDLGKQRHRLDLHSATAQQSSLRWRGPAGVSFHRRKQASGDQPDYPCMLRLRDR